MEENEKDDEGRKKTACKLQVKTKLKEFINFLKIILQLVSSWKPTMVSQLLINLNLFKTNSKQI